MILPISVEKFGSNPPYAVWSLIILNGLAFVATLASAGASPGPPTALVPNNFYAVSLIASLFMHAGFWHLLGNMFFLWLVGHNLENRLGPILFAVLYIFGGIIGGAMHLLIYQGTPAGNFPVIGASGAVSATLGAFLILFPLYRVVLVYWQWSFVGKIGVPALIFIGFWIFGQLFYSAMMPLADSGVAYEEHIFGFIFGAIFALILRLYFLPPSPDPNASPFTFHENDDHNLPLS